MIKYKERHRNVKKVCYLSCENGLWILKGNNWRTDLMGISKKDYDFLKKAFRCGRGKLDGVLELLLLSQDANTVFKF